mmetsp:Transcript_11013/g.44962  ORF Transcript_11013/g.44962 Transcript_11013/m.44962 type:complete len:356 (+) Transcript_11013:605-1672(+)
MRAGSLLCVLKGDRGALVCLHEAEPLRSLLVALPELAERSALDRRSVEGLRIQNHVRVEEEERHLLGLLALAQHVYSVLAKRVLTLALVAQRCPHSLQLGVLLDSIVRGGGGAPIQRVERGLAVASLLLCLGRHREVHPARERGAPLHLVHALGLERAQHEPVREEAALQREELLHQRRMCAEDVDEGVHVDAGQPGVVLVRHDTRAGDAAVTNESVLADELSLPQDGQRRRPASSFGHLDEHTAGEDNVDVPRLVALLEDVLALAEGHLHGADLHELPVGGRHEVCLHMSLELRRGCEHRSVVDPERAHDAAQARAPEADVERRLQLRHQLQLALLEEGFVVHHNELAKRDGGP